MKSKIIGRRPFQTPGIPKLKIIWNDVYCSWSLSIKGQRIAFVKSLCLKSLNSIIITLFNPLLNGLFWVLHHMDFFGFLDFSGLFEILGLEKGGPIGPPPYEIGLKSQSTYMCRVQSCVSRLPNYWPPSPNPFLNPARVSSPRTKGTRRAVRGVGGQYFGRRET